MSECVECSLCVICPDQCISKQEYQISSISNNICLSSDAVFPSAMGEDVHINYVSVCKLEFKYKFCKYNIKLVLGESKKQ